MQRKLISIILMLAMALSHAPAAFALRAEDFTDVTKDDWFYPYVDFTVNAEIMNGVSETPERLFAPGGNLTRAMAVTVLGRVENLRTGEAGGLSVDHSRDSGFSDVPADQWFTGYVSWANEKEIVRGRGEGVFDPNGDITRQEAATIISRYLDAVGAAKQEAAAAQFTDSSEIEAWAEAPVARCVEIGIINGYPELAEDGTEKRDENGLVLRSFQPLNKITRAEFCAMIQRLCTFMDAGENPVPTETPAPTESPDVTEPVQPTETPAESHTPEEQAEEEEIVGYLASMVDTFENDPKFTDQFAEADPKVQEALNILMGCIEDALGEHEDGVFLTTKYVKSAYSEEISELRKIWREIDDNQERELTTYISRLENVDHIYAVMDFFGVKAP